MTFSAQYFYFSFQRFNIANPFVVVSIWTRFIFFQTTCNRSFITNYCFLAGVAPSFSNSVSGAGAAIVAVLVARLTCAIFRDESCFRTLAYAVWAVPHVLAFGAIRASRSCTGVQTFWVALLTDFRSSFVQPAMIKTVLELVAYNITLQIKQKLCEKTKITNILMMFNIRRSISLFTYPVCTLQFCIHVSPILKFWQDKHWSGPAPQHPSNEH